MTAYANGYAFERKVAADLEADGYHVIQSRGSHGIVDLAAIKAGETLLVQCKGGDGGMTGNDWNELARLAWSVDAVPVVADRPSRGLIRYRAITGVHEPGSRDWPAELWDADRVAP